MKINRKKNLAFVWEQTSPKGVLGHVEWKGYRWTVNVQLIPGQSWEDVKILYEKALKQQFNHYITENTKSFSEKIEVYKNDTKALVSHVDDKDKKQNLTYFLKDKNLKGKTFLNKKINQVFEFTTKLNQEVQNILNQVESKRKSMKIFHPNESKEGFIEDQKAELKSLNLSVEEKLENKIKQNIHEQFSKDFIRRLPFTVFIGGEKVQGEDVNQNLKIFIEKFSNFLKIKESLSDEELDQKLLQFYKLTSVCNQALLALIMNEVSSVYQNDDRVSVPSDTSNAKVSIEYEKDSLVVKVSCFVLYKEVEGDKFIPRYQSYAEVSYNLDKEFYESKIFPLQKCA